MIKPTGTAAGTGPLTKHLPELFCKDELLHDFLEYYDELIAGIAARIDELPGYWDPATAPVGYDLRLMSSVKDVSDVPGEGKNLVVVAAVGPVLHFRVFDRDGKRVVDTDERRLAGQARQIEDLRKQLQSLWPPHELTGDEKDLTGDEKDRVVDAVTSIVGHTPPVEMLNWLGGWVDMELDPALPMLGRRKLLRSALVRAAKRGRVEGMQETVAAALGLAPDSVTVIDRPDDDKPCHFLIEIAPPDSSVPEATMWRDLRKRKALGRMVLRIVESEKPAHTFLDKITIRAAGSNQPETVWPT